MSTPEYFVDGIKKSYHNQGVVRLEFVSLGEEDSKPLLEPNLKLVTGLVGFLRMYQTLTETVDKLKEQGIIKEKETEEKE